MAKSNTKKEKTITEIFYDEWDNEIKPDDPNYEKYLNGDEYYGSYFVDGNGNVVKKIDPNKTEDSEKKEAKRAEKNKETMSEDATAKNILKGIAIVIGVAIALIAGWFLVKEIIIPLIVVLLFFFYLIGRKTR